MTVLATVSSLGLTVAGQEAQARDRDNKHDDMEITGPVEGLTGTCPNLRFKVKGKTVTTTSRAEFDDGTCANVRNGQRIELEGRLENGALVADEVDLD